MPPAVSNPKQLLIPSLVLFAFAPYNRAIMLAWVPTTYLPLFAFKTCL